MNLYKRIAVLLTTALLLLYIAVPAFSAESINPNNNIRLTLLYKDNGVPLSGAEFSIYKVAAADKHGNLTVTKEFSGYNINIVNNSSQEWKALASTLEGYVLRDKILPTDRKKTNKQGTALFPNNVKKLTCGMYLVLGKNHTQNNKVYESQPFMVLLPMRDKASDKWNYDVSVSPKYASHPQNKTDKVTCKVLKVWQDKGNEKKRPKQVVVQLLRDGKIFDTVKLNSGNNWRYKWSKLDADHKWTVAEKELKGYTVSISKEGVTFVITNTYASVPKDNPQKPVVPPDQVSSNRNNRLPQTGQLWWPVPLFAAIGLIFIVVGLLHIRRKKDGEN